MRITSITLLCLLGSSSDAFLQPSRTAVINRVWQSENRAETPLYYSKSAQGLVSEVNSSGGNEHEDFNTQRAIGPSLERAQHELDNINIDDFMSTISSEVVPHLVSVENMVRSINSLRSAGGALRSAIRVLDGIDLEPIHKSLVITIQSSIRTASKKVRNIDIDATSRILKDSRAKTSTDTSRSTTKDSKLSPVELLIREGDYDQALRRTVEDSKNAIDDIDAADMVEKIVNILENYIAEYYKHVNGLMALSMSITSSLPEKGKKDPKKMPSATAMGTGSARKSDSFVPALSHARQQLALLSFDAVSTSIAEVLQRPVSKAWVQLQQSNEETTRIMLSKVQSESEELVSTMLEVVENLTTSPGLSTILDPKKDGLINEVDPDNLDSIFEDAELEEEMATKMGSSTTRDTTNRQGSSRQPQGAGGYVMSQQGPSRPKNYGSANNQNRGDGGGGTGSYGNPKYGASPGYNVRDGPPQGGYGTGPPPGLVTDSTDLVGDTSTGVGKPERGWDSSGQGTGRFSRAPNYGTPPNNAQGPQGGGGPMYGGNGRGPGQQPYPGPGQQPQYPGAQRQGPGQQPPYPGAQRQGPGQQPPYPGAQRQGPGQQHQYPGAQRQGPGQHPQYPGAQRQGPGQQPPYPGAQRQGPGQQPPYPGAQRQGPGQQPPYPGAQRQGPGQQPNIYDNPQYGAPYAQGDFNRGGRPGGGPMQGGMGPMQGGNGMGPMQGRNGPPYGGGGPMQGGMGPMQGGMGPMQGGMGPMQGRNGPMHGGHGMGPMEQFQNPNGMGRFGPPPPPIDMSNLMTDGSVFTDKKKTQSQSSQGSNDYGMGQQYPAVEFAPRDFSHLMNDGSVFTDGEGKSQPSGGFGSSDLSGGGKGSKEDCSNDSQSSALNPTIEKVCKLIETCNSHLAKAQEKIDVATETSDDDSGVLSLVDSSNAAAVALMIKTSRTLTRLRGNVEDYISSSVEKLKDVESVVQKDRTEVILDQFQAMLDNISSAQDVMDTTVTEYHQMAKENRDLRGSLLESQTDLIKANEEIVSYESQAQGSEQFRVAFEQNKFNLRDAIQLVSASQIKHNSLYEANMCLMNAITVSRRALDDYQGLTRRIPNRQPASNFYNPQNSNGYGGGTQAGRYSGGAQAGRYSGGSQAGGYGGGSQAGGYGGGSQAGGYGGGSQAGGYGGGSQAGGYGGGAQAGGHGRLF